MGPIICPKTSTLRKIPKERRSNLKISERKKKKKIFFLFTVFILLPTSLPLGRYHQGGRAPFPPYAPASWPLQVNGKIVAGTSSVGLQWQNVGKKWFPNCNTAHMLGKVTWFILCLACAASHNDHPLHLPVALGLFSLAPPVPSFAPDWWPFALGYSALNRNDS